MKFLNRMSCDSIPGGNATKMVERKHGSRPARPSKIPAVALERSPAPLHIVSVRSFHQFEFIHAPPDIRFGHVDVALGIDVQRVAMREFAELMARAAELGDFVPLMIEDMDKLVAAVGND